MTLETSRPLAEIAQYYTDKLDKHGRTGKGVDWNGETSQMLRFQQLVKIINADGEFTISDIGCGYGALYEYLTERWQNFRYWGVDISSDMVASASDQFRQCENAYFMQDSQLSQITDYCIASGVFNVRLEQSDSEWENQIKLTLDNLDRYSTKAFAFNCLTSYSDAEKMHDYLYYANPEQMFSLCKKRFSRNVALLHDYDLYEFTILVRKNS